MAGYDMDTLNTTLHHDGVGDDLTDEELEDLQRRPLNERDWIDAHMETLIEVHARLKRYCEFYALGLLNRCSFIDFCVFCYHHSSHHRGGV